MIGSEGASVLRRSKKESTKLQIRHVLRINIYVFASQNTGMAVSPQLLPFCN